MSTPTPPLLQASSGLSHRCTVILAFVRHLPCAQLSASFGRKSRCSISPP